VSDYETAEKKRNIIVGIFVLIALGAFVWLIFMFGKLPTAITGLGSFRVFVQFPSAPGVQRDTPVRFCGYQIGRVADVMAPEVRTDLNTKLAYHQVLVVLNIDIKYANIPSNVQIRIMTRGLGSSYIELTVDPTLPLTPRDPSRPETKFLVDQMLLQGSISTASDFLPPETQKKLEDLANNLNTLISHADAILGDPQNKENIKTSLANLSDASGRVKGTLKELDRFLAAWMDVSEDLSGTIKELKVILEKIDTGQGTAAKFINDGRLYEELLENTQQMEVILQQLKVFIEKSNKEGSIPIKLK
jgi:phospholipid/cholesterol/gamma-HCH transport system substrate-binding protein